MVNRDDQLNKFGNIFVQPFLFVMHAAIISCSYSEYEFMELKNVYIANVYMGLCRNLISIRV